MPGVRIESLAYRGAGIGRVKGQVVFVSGAAPGDVAQVRVLRRQPDYLEGRVEHLEHPSPERTTPACPYFGLCGGCQWQHIAYAAQLNAKTEILRENLRRLGGIDEPPELKVFAADESYGYRRSLTLKVFRGRSGAALGFFAAASHRGVSIAACRLAQPEINEFLPRLAELIAHIPRPEELPEVEIISAGPGSVALACFLKSPGRAEQFLARRLQELKGLNGFALRVADRPPVFIDQAKTEEEFPTYALTMRVSVGGFRQASAAMNRKLVDLVVAWADLLPSDVVWDFFCGAGNLALPLARGAQTVLGCEADPVAVADARANAKRNGVFNSRFLVVDLRKPALAFEPVDVLVLDPPRRGLAELIPFILRLKPRRIIHIACDPAAGARDLKSLIQGGYRLRDLALLDFFPQTFHLETASLLTRG